MPNRRPKNLKHRQNVEQNHDELLAKLPEDHAVVGVLKNVLSTPLLTWRTDRDTRVAARGVWQVAVVKLQKCDGKCDDRVRTAFRMILLKHGQEAVDDLIKRAGGNNMSTLVAMPVDRVLVIYADLFASVDSAPEAPVYKDDLEKLREAVTELNAADQEELAARKAHAHATAAELISAGALDLACTRYAKAIEGLYGPADAELYLPKLDPTPKRAEATPKA